MRLTTLRLRVGPGRRWYRVVMGLLAVGMMSPVALRAQAVIVAGVADAESGLPLEGAEVLLVRQRRHAFSSAMGEATIRGVPRGVVRIRARRLGYAPAEIDLAVNADTVGVVFRLPRIATQLATVHTEVERLPPGLRDFEARRR